MAEKIERIDQREQIENEALPSSADISIPGPRFRMLLAYRTTFRVLISIGMFNLKSKVMGPEWTARNSTAMYASNARRVKKAILQLKGLFIKVGQMISIMSNFLPEDFREELEELQDRIPPRPLSEVRARLRQDFGADPETLFAVFAAEPIASASLAQVHKARMHDGREVAVKVQYVDIERTAKVDLNTIQRLLKIVGFIFRVRGMETNFRQIREMIHEELDFRSEATNIKEISANFEGDEQVFFPTVIDEFSSERVITTEFIDGVKISDLDALAGLGLDRQMLAERIVTAYCQMIFIDGIYHADPHPGNILVRGDGDVVFLDFGAVSRLSTHMKEGIPQFLEGVLRRDTEQITKALIRMGFIAHDERDYNADRLIEYVYSKFFEEMTLDSWNLQDLQVDMKSKLEVLADLRKMDISIREMTSTFIIPKDWVLLERTIVLLMGLCTHLSPTMNPMKTIRPYLEEFVLGKDRDWLNLVSSVVKDMVATAVTIPDEFKRFLGKANRGDLQLRLTGLHESANLIYALGHQILYGFFTLGCGAFAYLAHINQQPELARWLIGGSGIFALFLAGSMFSARRWRKRH